MLGFIALGSRVGELSMRVVHEYIIRSDVLMFISTMMFGWIITEVFKAGLVVESEVLLRFTV